MAQVQKDQAIYDARPLGSACTIIWIRYRNYGFEPEPQTAKLMLGALLSDADQLPGNGRLDSSSIGIRNVHRRLRLLYGKESGLTIRDSGDGKTVSELIICRQ